jgi:hypothetical protein
LTYCSDERDAGVIFDGKEFRKNALVSEDKLREIVWSKTKGASR